MRLNYFLLFIVLFIAFNGSAQSLKYWVFFIDKNGVEFDPYSYFDQKAIDRRLKNGLSLSDYTDLPVNENYTKAVTDLSDSSSCISRWFNAIAVYAQPEQVEKIRSLPFVESAIQMNEYEGGIARYIELEDFNTGQQKLIAGQTKRMGVHHFADNKINGRGVRVAVIDAGFTGFKSAEALRHTLRHSRIIGAWDFVGKDSNVYHGHSHGTMVASCIAGKIDSITMGLAPSVEFLLARTEKAFSDKLMEEEYWVAAMEWADKNGADIINTSLGYTTRRYFRTDMNGKSGLISRASTMASRKGIIVVNSAGNEGDGDWKVVAAPGDADSVLTVGGINPWTGLHASWSSYGPSSDKRLKPNVSAYGHVMVATGKGYEEQAGTSFSSPLVAGFAACILQLHPDWTNWQVYDAIMQSSDMYPYYDYAHGYGVPQAEYFYRTDSISADTAFDILQNDGKIIVNIRDKFFSIAEPVQPGYFSAPGNTTKEEMEDEKSFIHPEDFVYDATASYVYTSLPGYLFYHIENSEGYLDKYYVISVHQKDVLTLYRSEFSRGQTLRIFYKGYLFSIKF